MKSVEAEAGTIDDAIEKALEQLGTSRDRVDIEIVSNATRGLFGFGGKKAVVRATLRTPLDLQSAEGTASGESPPADAAAEARPARKLPAQERPSRRADDTRKPPRGAALEMEEGEGPPLDPASVEKARTVLADTVRLMSIDAQVRIVDGPEGPELSVDGDTSGLLIGRRGQTLDALEYFINRVVSRDAGRTAHLVVDSQAYRVRRRESLSDLAQRLAERARKRGAIVPMNPMSPRDRRVVHLALREDENIETRSSGKGHFRKLLIVPKRQRQARR